MQDWLTFTAVVALLGLRLFQLGAKKFNSEPLKLWEIAYTVGVSLAIDTYFGSYYNTMYYATCAFCFWLSYAAAEPGYEKGKLKIADLYYSIMAYGTALLYISYLHAPIVASLKSFAGVQSIRTFSESWHPAAQWFCYILAADFLDYWCHRSLHSVRLWRFHANHHLPEEVNFLAGNRGTLLHKLFIFVPYTVAASLFLTHDVGLALILRVLFDNLNQNYLHSTIRVPLAKYLEWFVVTPRGHLIHHNRNVHHCNYGFVFTLWDRAFGTYIDPDTIVDKTFGMEDKDKPNLDLVSMNFGFNVIPFSRKNDPSRRPHKESAADRDAA